jgi:integrase
MIQRRDVDLVPSPGEMVVGEPLTQTEYELLKAAFTCYRDILICKVLGGTGLRISELLRVTPEHLGYDGPDGFLFIRRGKQRNKKTRWEKVYLPATLAVELRDYIKGNAIQPGQRVFPISDRAVRYAFEKAGCQALGKSVSPHMLRHLYVSWCIDNGLPVPTTSKMVGHANSRTTEEVYYHLSAARRRDIQRRQPV